MIWRHLPSCLLLRIVRLEEVVRLAPAHPPKDLKPGDVLGAVGQSFRPWRPEWIVHRLDRAPHFAPVRAVYVALERRVREELAAARVEPLGIPERGELGLIVPRRHGAVNLVKGAMQAGHRLELRRAEDTEIRPLPAHDQVVASLRHRATRLL